MEYKWKTAGLFEIQPVEAIEIHSTDWIYIYIVEVRNIKFQTLEDALEVAKIVGIPEYQIAKYTTPDSFSNYEIVYMTPQLAEAYKLREESDNRIKEADQKRREGNRKKLEGIPNPEVWYTFSSGLKLVCSRTVGPQNYQINNYNNRVYGSLHLISSTDFVDRTTPSFWIQSYLTKDHKVLRKALVSDLSRRYDLSELEILKFANRLVEFAGRLRELNAMIV